jgi:hypothetical protein
VADFNHIGWPSWRGIRSVPNPATTNNVITAINSTVVVGDSNVATSKTENVSKKAWHETATFKIIVPILIGLLVAFFGYYFQWK